MSKTSVFKLTSKMAVTQYVFLNEKPIKPYLISTTLVTERTLSVARPHYLILSI